MESRRKTAVWIVGFVLFWNGLLQGMGSECFIPTTYRFTKTGNAYKYGWIQNIPGAPPPVLKYYLKRDFSQAVSRNESWDCNFSSGSDTSLSHSWLAGRNQGTASSTLNVTANLEQDELDGTIKACTYSGTQSEQSNTKDYRIHTWGCTGGTPGECYKAKDFFDDLSVSATLQDSGNCIPKWTGTSTTKHRYEVIESIYGDPPVAVVDPAPVTTTINQTVPQEFGPGAGTTRTSVSETSETYTRNATISNACGNIGTDTETTTITLSKEHTT